MSRRNSDLAVDESLAREDEEELDYDLSRGHGFGGSEEDNECLFSRGKERHYLEGLSSDCLKKSEKPEKTCSVQCPCTTV